MDNQQQSTTDGPSKSKKQKTTINNSEKWIMFMTRLNGSLTDLLHSVTEEVILENKIQFNDTLGDLEINLLCILPFWNSNTLQSFLNGCKEDTHNLLKKLLVLDTIPSMFLKKLLNYLKACIKKEPYTNTLSADAMIESSTAKESTSSLEDTIVVDATPAKEDGGILALKNWTSSSTESSTVSSSITVATDDSYQIFTAKLPIQDDFVELNIFEYVKYKTTNMSKRWTTANIRMKAVLTPEEMEQLKAVADKIADRIKNCPNLQVSSNLKKQNQWNNDFI